MRAKTHDHQVWREPLRLRDGCVVSWSDQSLIEFEPLSALPSASSPTSVAGLTRPKNLTIAKDLMKTYKVQLKDATLTPPEGHYRRKMRLELEATKAPYRSPTAPVSRRPQTARPGFQSSYIERPRSSKQQRWQCPSNKSGTADTSSNGFNSSRLPSPASVWSEHRQQQEQVKVLIAELLYSPRPFSTLSSMTLSRPSTAKERAKLIRRSVG